VRTECLLCSGGGGEDRICDALLTGFLPEDKGPYALSRKPLGSLGAVTAAERGRHSILKGFKNFHLDPKGTGLLK